MKKRKIGISACARKKKFKTKVEAENRCREILKDGGKELRAYRCNFCGDYHLTSMSEQDQKKARKKMDKYQRMEDRKYEKQFKREVDYWLDKYGLDGVE